MGSAFQALWQDHRDFTEINNPLNSLFYHLSKKWWYVVDLGETSETVISQCLLQLKRFYISLHVAGLTFSTVVFSMFLFQMYSAFNIFIL
jgi:hypothetical protein